eukprot:952247-Rhodomonas_salina.1
MALRYPTRPGSTNSYRTTGHIRMALLYPTRPGSTNSTGQIRMTLQYPPSVLDTTSCMATLCCEALILTSAYGLH